jgi:hypothetical protein
MKPRYPLNQSPLYMLHSRRKLAELLNLTLQDLNKTAAEQDAHYNRFPRVIKKDGIQKTRYIEHPKLKLRFIQKRFVQLLDRIQPPDYLHSGFRGRSYISNARVHSCHARTAKIDIKSFFPSAYAGYVYRSFADVFRCTPDVAATITKLTTAFGHIPTGGNSSTIISFFAFKPMFDEIFELAQSRGLTMSCCVDDMTFSGDAATNGFLNEVQKIASRYGLKTHKRHCCEPGQSKIITGVALTPQGIRLPNKRREKLHNSFKLFDEEVNPFEKVKLGTQMLGRATEAAQVEEKFIHLIPLAAKKLNEARRLKAQN